MGRRTAGLCTANAARSILAVFCLLVAAWCAVLPRNAVPSDRVEVAAIPGMPPEIRALGLAPSPMLQNDFANAIVDVNTAPTN